MKFRAMYAKHKTSYGWQKNLKYLRERIKAKGQNKVARKLSKRKKEDEHE